MQHDRLFAGISGTLSSPLIGGANSLASAAQGLGGRDGQYSIAPSALAAYRTVQALGKAEDAYKAWQNKGGDLKDLPAAIGSASLTVGFEHSSSRTLQQSSTPVVTTLHSGAATTIEAEQGSIHGVGVQITAGPAPKGTGKVGKDGNETIGGDPAAALGAAGSGGDPAAGTISLRAGQGIFLESAQATVDTLFGSQSSKLGVDLNGGFAAEGAYGRDSGQSHAVHQVDSHVLASGTVSLSSGGDTALKGAVVSGAQVVAEVGGDLTIESRPDTARYRESSVQAQGRINGGTVSGSINSGSVRGDSSNVAEQSGLIAGSGGYQITVGGGVDLKGGVITSTADRSQNRLSADHLTFSDLVNSSRASASSLGLSIGGTLDGGLGLPTPQAGMPVQDSSSGVARATLSPGTLDLGHQQQDLSGLNTDATRANTQARPFDVERLQARQRSVAALSELMNIGVGELSTRIGLAEGSPEKAALHAAVGALTAMVAGGNVASGALAGAASEVANGVLQHVLRANPNLTDEQKAAITQWVGAGVGALAGGQLGAATGLDNVTHNYLTHKQITDFLSERAECGSDDACRQQVADKYRALSQAADAALRACETDECRKEKYKDIQDAKPLLRKLDPTTNAVSDGLGPLFSLQTSEAITHSMHLSMQWQSALEWGAESCGTGNDACIRKEAAERFKTLQAREEDKAMIADLFMILAPVLMKGGPVTRRVGGVIAEAEPIPSGRAPEAESPGVRLGEAERAPGVEGPGEGRAGSSEGTPAPEHPANGENAGSPPSRSSQRAEPGASETPHDGGIANAENSAVPPRTADASTGPETPGPGQGRAGSGVGTPASEPPSNAERPATSPEPPALPAPEAPKVPEGYTAVKNADGSWTVTGPNNGTYQSTGLYDRDTGLPVFETARGEIRYPGERQHAGKITLSNRRRANHHGKQRQRAGLPRPGLNGTWDSTEHSDFRCTHWRRRDHADQTGRV